MRAVRAIGLASVVSLLLASPASAAFLAPSFVRQWDLGPVTGSPFSTAAHGIATDPFGDVYVLKGVGGGSSQVLKFNHDGAPVAGPWTDPIDSPRGIATDAQGHVYIGQGSRLLQYTPGGGLLGEYYPKRLSPVGGPIAVDASGHVYANGTDASGQPAVNEYSFTGTKYKLVHSGAFPGTPNPGFFPPGFLGLTVDPEGNVYASGISTTSRFLLKFGPALAGPASHLEDCPGADLCFGGFGLAWAPADVSTTTGEQPTVFAAGGHDGGSGSDFYRVGVYGTVGGPRGTSRHEGSYSQHPVPGNLFTNVASLAASPCHAAVYELVNVFGGPGNTLSANGVQQFDTHAAPTACASPPKAKLSGFAKRYAMQVPKGDGGLCVPCAGLLRSGAFAPASKRAASASATASKRKARGLTVRYGSSAAADTTFLFKRVAGTGPKRRLGGFVYAARAGRNALRFGGALRKGRHLSPGTYRVTVSAGINNKRFKLRVLAKR